MPNHAALYSSPDENRSCKGMGLPAIADKSFSIDNLNKTACALGRQIHEGDFICICAFEESGWSLEERIIPKFKLQPKILYRKYTFFYVFQQGRLNIPFL